MRNIFYKITNVCYVRQACLSLAMLSIVFSSASSLDAQTKLPQKINSIPVTANTAIKSSEFAAMAEADANRVIERHIPRDAFQVIVKVTAKKLAFPQSAYMPDALSNASPAIPGSWRAQSENIQIEVRLAARYGDKTRTSLADLLADKLDLDKKSITFTKLLVELPTPRTDLEIQLQKAEADSRSAKGAIDQITREREDAKRELSLAKSELDKNARASLEKKQTPEKAKPLEKAPVDKVQVSPYAKYLPLIAAGIGVLIFVAIIFVGMSFRSTATAIGSAVRAIGESIPVLGDKMIEAAALTPALGAAGGGAGEPLQLASDSNTNSGNGVSGSSLAGIPLDSLHTRLVAIHEELTSSINTNNEFVLIRYLTHLMKQENHVGKAVVSLEILGKELANKLYTRLSSDDQEKIWKFLESGTHSRSKWELMLEAGEELKTKLMAEGMVGLKGKVNQKIAERILKLQTEDICTIANKIDVESVPRLLLYLEPNQLADVLMHVRTRDKKQFKRLSTSILKIATAIKDTRLDADIAKVMDSHFATLEEDLQRPFLGYYKSVVDLLDDSAAEDLAEVFSTGGPTIENFVQENVVTFATFFKLQRDLQETIIEELANKDLASLVAGLSGVQANAVSSLISDKRTELIQEEIERAQNKGKRVVEQSHTAVKRSIVKKIIGLKGNGEISDLFGKASDAEKTAQEPLDIKTSAA